MLDAIERRRTIRDFAPCPIPSNTLHRLLAAGLLAPTGGGHRPWRFILVEDPKVRSALADGFRRDRTPEEVAVLVDSGGVEDVDERGMYLDAIPRLASMIEGAGALIVPCFQQPEPLLAEKASLHQLNGVVSIWLCVENILLAAAEEGIFGVTRVPATPEETENVRRVLGIPGDMEVPCYLALGYPGAAAQFGERKPADVAAAVSIDRWSFDV